MCSVLFVDLVGFTTVSEGRDPEDVRELLSRYFELAQTVIGRYGGTIEKFIGDAVMAVWGTPIATEEDAERAVRAALDLVESIHQLGVESGVPGLTARAGVLTGEVAVTIGATNEAMVAGDAVNTAARIQSAAGPGAVFVDATTQRLTASAISYTDEGDHVLKGKADPERLWRAVRVVSSVGGAQRVDGLEAPLTGRDGELRTVREMFHASTERSQARLMLVTGPAGVGKSRLGWEFEKYIDGLADITLWHRGRCLSYGDGLTYWALAEVVRQRLGVAEEDPADVVSDKLADGLARWVPDQATREFIAPRLARLLGAPTHGAPTFTRDDLFAGWRGFIEQLTADAPVTILMEDLHHASTDLLDFVDHLVDWARDLPIFVLGFARSEIEATRPGFGTGRNRATITLDPLDTASMEAIVDQLVPGMPAEPRRRITARAEGIPLYALESIRALIDRDVIRPVDGHYRLVGEVGELVVPDSLHSLLAARLDALDPATRRVVCDASVLGASFPAEAIAAVCELASDEVARVMSELLRREVFEVSADPLSPQRGNYRFSQEMFRQVAYDTLARRDRKTRHLAVATHLRNTFPNDGEEVIDAVARHYQDALDAVPDDTDTAEIRQQLVHALTRSAERALRTGSPRRAVEASVAAADLVEPHDPVRAAELLIRALEQGLGTSEHGRMTDLAQRARGLALAHEHPRLAARALTWHGRMLRRQRHYADARELLTEALALLRTEPDLDTVFALEQLAAVEVFAETDAASGLIAEMLQLASDMAVDTRVYAELLVISGIHFMATGQDPRAIMYLREAARLADQTGDLGTGRDAYLNLASALMEADPLEAIEAATQAVDMCLRAGSDFGADTSLVNIAYSHLALGDWDAAEDVLFHHPALDHLRDLSDIELTRAEMRARRGDAAGARALLDRSQTADDIEDAEIRSQVAMTKAFIALADGDHQRCLEVCLDDQQRAGVRIGSSGAETWNLALRTARHLGRGDTVAELLARYDQHPVGAVSRATHAHAQLARAEIAGDPEGVAAAVGAMRAYGDPYQTAHALLDQAAFVGVNEGAALVAEAIEIAERLKCEPLLARARALATAPA